MRDEPAEVLNPECPTVGHSRALRREAPQPPGHADGRGEVQRSVGHEGADVKKVGLLRIVRSAAFDLDLGAGRTTSAFAAQSARASASG